MVRRFLIIVLVIAHKLLQADFKCVTSFATTCERLSDISGYATPIWDTLIIKPNECNSGKVQKSSEVLTAGVFNTTSSLEYLYISEKLSSIETGAFSGLENLKYLKLWGNQLKVLPKGAFLNFNNLQKLDLRHNKIENLVHGFCGNSFIKEIDLSSNDLTNIQVDMLDLESLEILNLAHNRLSFIAPQSFHITCIELDLSYNNLESFQANTVENLPNLRRLVIPHNKLTTIPLLTALQSLDLLDLSYNNLNTIPNEAFSHLPELKTLYLDNNNLKELNPSAFTRTVNIKTLHLHRNNLTSLADGLFNNTFPELKEVTIGANPWFCKCLTEITRYVKRRKIQLSRCEEQYFSDGKAPVCVSIRADCGKGAKLSDGVYGEFASALGNYKCD